MASQTAVSPPIETLADLLERLGHIPLERIRFHPWPGAAAEPDVLVVRRQEGRSCELVDGVLVERATGFAESMLAAALIELLNAFVRPRNLGLVTGEAGTVRLFPGLVRIPDVAFTAWEQLPGRCRPADPIPQVAPWLVVEVLSAGNTPAEMARKLDDYFGAGVRLVWIADPPARTVRVHQDAQSVVELGESDVLDGREVLPGFRLPLHAWFAELDRRG
jgi:Uma2 family endonuclease